MNRSDFEKGRKSVDSHRDRKGPGRETQNCRHFWTRVGSSRLKSVNSHRDRKGPGRETQNCRHFWTRVGSSRLKSVNSLSNRSPPLFILRMLPSKLSFYTPPSSPSGHLFTDYKKQINIKKIECQKTLNCVAVAIQVAVAVAVVPLVIRAITLLVRVVVLAVVIIVTIKILRKNGSFEFDRARVQLEKKRGIQGGRSPPAGGVEGGGGAEPPPHLS